MATAEASSQQQLGFPPKGSLKRYPFPRLMREVARHKLTGALYLLSTQTKKVVFFEQGQPVFVRSNVLSECLGQVLSTEGLITQEQCEQTLEAIRRTGKKQGELLVEMGILSEGNLRYGLEAQLRAKLYDIFSWEDGRYQFKNEAPNLQFGIKLSMSAEGVIIGAIQDRYGEQRARTALEPYFEKFLLLRQSTMDSWPELDLLPEEIYFTKCLDGSRPVDEIVTGEIDPPVPSPHALVYGLLQAGIVQLSDRKLDPKPHPRAPELGPGSKTDPDLSPDFEAQDVVTEYEDTPLPGELPRVRGLLGDHEDDFAGVEDEEGPPLVTSAAPAKVEVSEDLVAAEPERVEETFDDDQIELADDEVEIVDHPTEGTNVDMEPDLTVNAHDLQTVVEGSEPRAIIAEAAAAVASMQDDLELGAPETEPELVGSADLMEVADEFEEPEEISAEPIEEPEPISVEAEPVSDVDDLADELAADDDLLLPDEVDDVALEPDAELEVDDDMALEVDFSVDELSANDIEPADEPAQQPAAGDGLVGLDELDDVDLGSGGFAEVQAPGAAAPAKHTGPESTMEDAEDPEMIGAIRFNEAETAMSQNDFPNVVALLEEAYDNGFDVAELHAMLAYARFMAAGQDNETAEHAFELLDYAQNMDPSLDLVHAYRGAIYSARSEPERAREALDRALELNPYCELAMEIMDQLG